jgi:hypothetical protein
MNKILPYQILRPIFGGNPAELNFLKQAHRQ